MDATLHALGGILLKAIPTLILLLLLNIYLKLMFFKPLQAVLEKRRQATEGAREAAQASVKKAAEITAEYEGKMAEARSEIYREQEEMRKGWLDEQNHRLEEARQKTRELVLQAKHQIEGDVAAARKDLAASSEALADQIAHTLLERRAS